MNQELAKQRAAEAALSYIQSGDVVGVGTGSTTRYFIEALAKMKDDIDGAVASSVETEKLLKQHQIEVHDLNHVGTLPVYVDGADEATEHRHLIKGGGGALSREKIIAEASQQFICITDQSKKVDRLGAFPLPIEVLPMARSLVGRKLLAEGGQPELRTGFTTDNGNIIIDIHNLNIMNPVALEKTLNQIPGIVTVGLFAIRGADVLLVADETDVEVIDQ